MVFDKSWSLFLDRDGVINQRKMDAYVLQPEEFLWTTDAQKSIALLSNYFNPVVVVTNQQGIGKGLMTETDLQKIHAKLMNGVEDAGGKIDKIYHCPATKESRSFDRKPMPGMAIKAKRDFPQINFRKAIMVGDTLSDMRFGKNLKMTTVLIETDKKLISSNHKIIDFVFSNLNEFAIYVSQKQNV